MKDAGLINCVFLFPCRYSLQHTLNKYSLQAAKQIHIKRLTIIEQKNLSCMPGSINRTPDRYYNDIL